jgi:arginine/lysine/ornithine decarboxylase
LAVSGRHREALEHYGVARDGLQGTSPSHPLVASLDYFRGRSLEALGETAAARELYERALDVLGVDGQPDRPGARELRDALRRLDD